MDTLREAAAVYDRGRLVPFIGSGMSVPVCTDWTSLIERIESLSGTGGAGDPATRAERALERLRLGRGLSTSDVVDRVLLSDGPQEPPRQTQALAGLPWPLVLSTNYDDLYPASVHQRELGTRRLGRPRTGEGERREPVVRVLGRSPVDCHRVLSSLRHPAPPLLWAMQGYLGGQAVIRPPDGRRPVVYQNWLPPGGLAPLAPLRRQIVVGHAEYRRVALRSEGFRRAFGEVFRSRALLFLGSGLADRYLLDLFGQVIELYGPTSHPHFAIAVRGRLDVEFLRRQFGIWVHEISAYDELPDAIGSLRGRGSYPYRRFAFSVASRRLNVVTAPLPEQLTPSQCLVLSGGGSTGPLRLSDWSRTLLARTAPVTGQPEFVQLRPDSFIWHLRTPASDRPTPLVLAARARLDPASPRGRRLRPMAPSSYARPITQEARGRLWRDVRLTRHVLREAMEVARAAGKTEVLSPILASGSLRTITPSHQLIEMIRAWADCGVTDGVDLTIHAVDEVAATDLRSGRIDVERLLPAGDGSGAPETIDYWLEIAEPDGAVSRILMVDNPAEPVREVLAGLGLAGDDWLISVDPVPCLDWAPWPLPGIDPELTLERLGVLHGSTLRVFRPSRLGQPQ